MPIDPSIPGGIKTFQPPDILDTVNKIQGLRNAKQLNQQRSQEMQVTQEKLQQDQIATAKMQRDQQDSERVRQAFLQSGGDPKQTLQLAIQNGAGPEAITGLQKHFSDLDEKTAKIDSERLPVQIAKNSQLLELHDQALQLAQQNPAEYQRAWPEIAARAAQLDPEAAKHADPNQPWTPQQLLTSKALHMTQDFMLKQTAEKRASDQETRTAALAVPQLTEAQNKATTSTPNRAGLTAEQQAEADRAAATAKEAGRHNTATEKTAAGELGIKVQEMQLKREQAGFEMGGGVSETAKAAANGDLAPQTVRSLLRKSPGLINQIKQVDPNFDEANLENRYNTLKEFTNTSTGKAGGQALALNTMIHHADLYLETAEALKNGSFVPGNKVYNAVASAFGSAPPQNAAAVARFLASETGKVATGGVPAEGEIKGILDNLSTSASPDQIAGAGKTLLQIASGRATPLMERAKAAKIDKVVNVLGPDAKAILSRRGFDPETMKPVAGGGTVKMKAPDGTVQDVPSDQVEHYKSKGAVIAQ